jgi:hypothetical protein
MPIISYAFSASFGAAIGAIFGPLGLVAYVFAAILLFWCAICFLRASDCDASEFAHMAVPVGSGCVGLAFTSTPSILWEVVGATFAVVVVAFFLLFCLKRVLTRTPSREGE